MTGVRMRGNAIVAVGMAGLSAARNTKGHNCLFQRVVVVVGLHVSYYWVALGSWKRLVASPAAVAEDCSWLLRTCGCFGRIAVAAVVAAKVPD